MNIVFIEFSLLTIRLQTAPHEFAETDGLTARIRGGRVQGAHDQRDFPHRLAKKRASVGRGQSQGFSILAIEPISSSAEFKRKKRSVLQQPTP
jgi:hypothetical protein